MILTCAACSASRIPFRDFPPTLVLVASDARTPAYWIGSRDISILRCFYAPRCLTQIHNLLLQPGILLLNRPRQVFLVAL
jgi:hypothetical protein